MTIYQLFCGRHESANRATHKGQVLSQMTRWPWENFRQSGFDSVYLLGIFNHQGPVIVTEEEGLPLGEIHDRVPSVFAITNHREVDPDLGDLGQLQRLIEKLHTAGLKIIVDLVVNQTSTVHPWLRDHPEFYRQTQNGLVTAFSQDVWLLDHGQPQVVNYFGELVEWMVTLGIDGVRCDMAHLSQPELWTQLIVRAKRINPQFQFIAEAYGESVFDWQPLDRLLECGFDLVYHEYLYRNLKEIVSYQTPWKHFVDHVNYVIQSKRAEKQLHYLSNHDDGPVEQKGKTSEGLMSLIRLLPGHCLIYNGTLNGLDKRLAHHRLDILASDKLELFHLPNWFVNLTVVKSAFQPVVEQLYLDKPGVIQTHLANSSQHWEMWLNVSEDELILPERSNDYGLLHRKQANDRLMPGSAELWFLR